MCLTVSGCVWGTPSEVCLSACKRRAVAAFGRATSMLAASLWSGESGDLSDADPVIRGWSLVGSGCVPVAMSGGECVSGNARPQAPPPDL